MDLCDIFAYLLGVFHSDGCIYEFYRRGNKSLRINLTVGEKSLPMADKFRAAFCLLFERNVGVRKVPKKRSYSFQTSINRIKHHIQPWDNHKIPLCIENDPALFGSYLAGMIDGDGYIKIKNSQSSWRRPQCIVRIASDRQLVRLNDLIAKHMGCGVHIQYDAASKGTYTCFYISKKNAAFMMQLVHPHMEMQYKKERIETYCGII